MSSDFYAAPPPAGQKLQRPRRPAENDDDPAAIWTWRRPRPSAMVLRNRILIAERTGWPEGALADCLRIERECPGFRVAWFAEWKTAATAFNREAGFYAWVAGEEPLHRGVQREEWYGATPEELKAKLGG